MTSEELHKILTTLTDQVLADPQWQRDKDDLGVTVLGLILYGYGLSMGRMIMMLHLEDINTVVKQCLVEQTGAGENWVAGLIDVAAYSAFDPSYHPGYSELIHTGQQYLGEENVSLLVENVLANIQNIRRQVELEREHSK